MIQNDKLSPIAQGEETMPVISCPHCQKGSDFLVTAKTPKKLNSKILCAVGSCRLCEKEVWFELEADNENIVLSQWPRLKETPPDGLPPNVQRAFAEALACVNTEAWNGTLLMCRRAIDDALDELGAPEKGDLPTKLAALVADQVITPTLKDWADQARIGGKLAAHGTGGDEWGQPDKDWADKKDADEVVEFCRSFFEYAYVMKARLDQRRGQTPA